jgi:hypothetical protein
MMKALGLLIWSVGCVACGIGLATWEFEGLTPVEHAQRTWKRRVNPSKVDQLKNGLRDALDNASSKVEHARGKQPSERYLDEEREAIERLIAKSRTN